MTDWKAFYQQHGKHAITLPSSPEEWQVELAALLMDFRPKRCLEAGSGYGMTSLLLDNDVSKTLLDLETVPLRTASGLFEQKRERGCCAVADILNMPFPDNSFDIVFNSGVLEHFDFPMRRMALREMLRVAGCGGRVVAAIPNHFSRPYRYSYVYRKQHGQWPYPDEYMLYDFFQELGPLPNVGQQTRMTLAKETAYHFLRRHQRILFKIIGKIRRFEGYLAVIIIEKNATSA
ncbi:MAG: class I SAM-dependent methyltransferase [Candidatus Electrothrix sp. AR4]|nr:class I SAM-dependent methyltransferase [Candidatus Electrothrix sp. AR4]